MFEIEKGVPVAAKSRARKSKYPWLDMAVGDSFFAPGRTVRAMSAVIGKAARVTGFKFTSRTVEGGVRVWRTK